MFSSTFGLDDNVFLALLALPIVELVSPGLFKQAFDHATNLHLVLSSQRAHDLYVTMLQTTVDTLVRAICEPIVFTLFRLARQVVRTALVIVYNAALCINAAVLCLWAYLPYGMKGIALVGVWAGTVIPAIANGYNSGVDYLDSGMTRVLAFLTISVIKSSAVLQELKERVARRPINSDIPLPTPLPSSISVTISNLPRAHFTVPVIECVSPVSPTRAEFPLPSLAERTSFHRLTSTDLVSAYQYGYYSIANPFITGTAATDVDDADASAPIAKNEESNDSVTQVKDVEVSLAIQDLPETPTSCGLLSGHRYRRYLITKAYALPCPSVSTLPEPPTADRMPLVVTLGTQINVDSPFAPVRVLAGEPQDADITLVAEEDALDHGGSSPIAKPSPQMARPTVQLHSTPTSSSGPSSSASIHPAADVGAPKRTKPRKRTKKKPAQGDMVTTELNASFVPDLLAEGDYSSLTLTPSIWVSSKSRQALCESDLEVSSAVAPTSSRLISVNQYDQYDHLLCAKSGTPSLSDADAVPQHRKPFKKTRRGRDKQKKANATLRASGVCGNGCGGLCY
ncbi:hypothetical protein C8Q74DRAFT_402529 [Fomes fomentarius]|nr:hypothetical protein C8Q74DRAFT_402529 [Fomes fomentarius]